MSSLHAIQLLTAAARLAREGNESFSKEDINKKLQEIKYLSLQKKVPRLSLRKEIIQLEDQLKGVLDLEEKLNQEKDKESVKVASLKQQIEALKNKLKAAECLNLDKKVEHLSFLLGEHLAKKEVADEVALTEKFSAEEIQEVPPEDKHKAGIDAGKKAAMLHKRLEALKQELEIHQELKTKKPQEIKQIEETIKSFEDKLEQYYEHHPEAMLQEIRGVEVTAPAAPVEVKHKMLFPQAEMNEEEKAEAEEERKEAERELPLPPPPRMKKKETS